MARNPHPREGRSEPQSRRRYPLSAVCGGGVEHRPGHGRAARPGGATARDPVCRRDPDRAVARRAIRGPARAPGRRPAPERADRERASRHPRRGAPHLRRRHGGLAGVRRVARQLAGAGLDSGAVGVRFADRRLYVDSLRVMQSGLTTTGSGSLGWTRGTRGQLALDFDADSLNVLDPLVRWLEGGAPDAPADLGGGVEGTAPLAGSAHLLLRLQGSLDSLGLDARATVERLEWRAWRGSPGPGPFSRSPGPAPAVSLAAT